MASGETDDKLEKYTKSLLSTWVHLLGLREDQDGKLHVTVRADDDDGGRVNVENVNLQTAQQWEAAAFLSAVAELGVLPPEKILDIRRRVDEVKISEAAGFSKSSAPPSTNFTTGDAKVSKQEDTFMGKGPSGFYPPQRLAPVGTSGVGGGTDSANEFGQKKQFTFAKSKPVGETPSASVTNPVYEPSSKASLFSSFEQPVNKKPAFGLGSRPGFEDRPNPKPNTGVDRGDVGANQWNNPSTTGKEVEPAGGIGPFKTAYQQLLIDDKKKGIQRTIPPASGGMGGGSRPQGLLRRQVRQEPERKQPNSDEVIDPRQAEVDELMTHECMKNIDPKMVTSILNEVMQVSNTNFEDIAGLAGVKRIIQEIIIWPMERPDIFVGLRAAPRGILFFGPPGTGKTMFGRVIATQSKSTFFNISASSLTSKWIGDGEKMVRALFTVARVKQPSVIFIDEIDSILTQRSDTEHESSRRLKTEFLIQFDGCGTTTEDRILVIGVTNRPQELDEAARRRLVKRIYIPLPDSTARKGLVKNLIKDCLSDLSEEDLDKISTITEGYSGADMKSLCTEASLGPIRAEGHQIQNLDLSKVRPIKMKDFVQAQRQVKSSVAESDVYLYEEWDKKFGCQIGSSPDDLTQSS